MSNNRGNDETLEDPFADPFNDDDTSDMEFVSVGGSTVNFQQDLQEPYGSDRMDDSEFGGGSSDDYSGERRGGRGQQMDPNQLFGVNPKVMQAISQQNNRQQKQSRVLASPKKSVWERGMHNTGIMYLTGLSVGGSIGLVRGFVTSPSPRPRILLNSILNGCGRGGSTMGNTLGTLAMLYTGSEWVLDQFEFDTFPDYVGLKRREIYTQMAAAAMTGMIYRLPAFTSRRNARGLAVMLSAGAVGASTIALTATVGSIVDRSQRFVPFTFA
eukprot:gb/GECG01012936.1/.p1 GENE.gb/GECG01012936.1/~~gb/GECG01012936.1/.p1  ORF type:complete len:270 (+),score=31.76 gb/GECG01012936.1/:1-810(+)